MTLCLGCAPPAMLTTEDRLESLNQLEDAFVSASPSDAGTTEQVQLVERIDAILTRELQHRRLDARVNAAWQIIHGVVCYGQQLQIETPDRGVVGAVDYALHSGAINGFELGISRKTLPATGGPGVVARLEPGSYVGQGHPDQWLAYFAMGEIPLESEVEAGGEVLTIRDWVRQAQADVTKNMLDEFSWTLIALTHYFPEEPEWTAEDGSRVSWELLVDVELNDYDLDAAPCGGTHRMAGIVLALQAKRRLGLPDTEIWNSAQALVDRCIAVAKGSRSADGGLSSYYFARPNQSADLSAELSGSGHLLEFLALALPDSELDKPWVQLAAIRLCNVLDTTQDIEMECGALYHALNGLKMYRQRLTEL